MTGSTVQVLPYQSGAVDDYGNPVDTWGDPMPKSVIGWAPAGTFEVKGWRHVTTADVQLLAKPDFTCDSRDRVLAGGKTYEVEGDPEDYAIGVLVNLKLIEGSQ